MIMSAELTGSWHSYVQWRFPSCSAAVVARAGVRCTACVGVHESAVSDYSGKFPHIQ